MPTLPTFSLSAPSSAAPRKPRGHKKQAAQAAREDWLKEHPETFKPAPPRPWGKPPEAGRQPPWWCIRRMGPHGATHGPVYRHTSRENAEREAGFLAEHNPGAVYVVMEALSVHVTGVPEIKMTQEIVNKVG